MLIVANCEGIYGIKTARTILQNNGSALDAIEKGIVAVEENENALTVGKGGAPNLLGQMECDASIMDGRALQTGSVGALRGYPSAIRVARKVMERLPHVFLAGDGAARFAQEIGEPKTDILTQNAKAKYDNWIQKYVDTSDKEKWPDIPLDKYSWQSGKQEIARGTTVFLAIDSDSNIACGTSTSGWAYCYPGRLGDSPVIGAGLYADNRYGACACTHTGEMTIRTCTAHSVVTAIKYGASVEHACREAIEDLRRLREGYLGPVVIHAIDKKGNVCVCSTEKLIEDNFYVQWNSEDNEIQQKEPVVF